MYACMHVFVIVYIYMYVCVYVNTYVYTHTQTHVYIYICTHTHTHKYIYNAYANYIVISVPSCGECVRENSPQEGTETSTFERSTNMDLNVVEFAIRRGRELERADFVLCPQPLDR
jgi:hypothetical protein